MHRKMIVAFTISSLFAVGAFAATATTTTKHPKVTMAQAQATALSRVPGQVKSAELENEGGKLIYSFDIATAKDVTEVNVNAIDGKIVAVQHESAAKEAAENKQEAKDKSPKH